MDRRNFVHGGASFGGLALGSASLLSGCVTPQFLPAPAVVKPPELKVGQTWVYAEINRYNNLQIATVTHQVKSISPVIRVARTDDKGITRAEEIYDSQWAVRQEPNYEQTQVFEKPLPMLPSRLEAGVAEDLSTAYRIEQNNNLYIWQSRLRAIGWERVKVPAGEYTALRVERTFYFAHFDSFRYDNMRVDTLWFVPEINHWVRREWTGSYRSPGSRRIPLREDWVRWDLIQIMPPLSGI